MFFKKDKQKKNDENEALLRKLDGRPVRYVSERNSADYGETILGKDGTINVSQDRITILCSNKVVLDQAITDVQGSEFMSLDGVNLKFKDPDTGEYRTLVAYYKYYRK